MTNPNLSHIGKNVRQLRKARKWTQDESARKAGISRIALIHIESGKATPTLETLSALAGVYEEPLTSLLVADTAERNEMEEAPSSDGMGAFEYEIGQMNRSLKSCTLAEIMGVRKVVDAIMSGFGDRLQTEKA